MRELNCDGTSNAWSILSHEQDPDRLETWDTPRGFGPWKLAAGPFYGPAAHERASRVRRQMIARRNGEDVPEEYQ